MKGLRRVGVWLGALGWAPATVEREIAAEVEQLGYGALWYSEAHNSKESLSHGALLLAATQRIVIASGIANIWVRDPMAAVAGSNALAEAYPGRFVLGLGVSHPPQVGPRGHSYEKPVAAMRAYLQAMNASEYTGPRPSEPVPRLLGALRPAMLELAATMADGAHPYLVPVEHTRRARSILGRESCSPPSSSSCWRTIRPRLVGSAARRSPGISPCRTTPTTCAGSASPRRISPTAAATRSSTRWWRGVTRTRSADGSSSTSRPAPTTSAFSRSAAARTASESSSCGGSDRPCSTSSSRP